MSLCSGSEVGPGPHPGLGSPGCPELLGSLCPPMSRHLLRVPAEGRPVGPDRSNRGLRRGALRGLEVGGWGRTR